LLRTFCHTSTGPREMMINRTFTRSNEPCSSVGMGAKKSPCPSVTFPGRLSVGRNCSDEMSKPWNVYVGCCCAISMGQIPVPVPMSAMRAFGGSLEVTDGCRRYPILRVQILCCLRRRFCSSEARPSQYGSEEAGVLGGVSSAMVGGFMFAWTSVVQKE
jgi:hypothetical protein